ncbi:MAG: 2-oxoglutarate dehydrogenase E1/E2 component [Chlamydiia bacterium]|nr:2-oxoglutarate dehydrogenase E1/E2 component [Chlamydiia bacterium]
MQENEFLHFENQGYIYEMYERFQKQDKDLPAQWLYFFQGMELNQETPTSNQSTDTQRVIDYFKKFGHLYAKTNSLFGKKVFDLERFFKDLSLTKEDLTKVILTPGFKKDQMPLSEFIEELKSIYCEGIGIEFITSNKEKEDFLHQEVTQRHVSKDEIINGLKEVGKAKLLEDFLQKKFLGAKRFSVEGGESVLTLLKSVIDEASKLGFKEGYIGMSHRGRVNTLCHIMEKPYGELFEEFKTDRFPEKPGLGDVKYHNGYKNKVKTYSDKEIYLEMAANPSHLEAVDAVLPGMIRARLDDGLDKALGIVVHGDAAVSGQGVVYETIQFNNLDGYKTGGTIHVVIDNHIGFTTDPRDSRSTLYPTDVAKVFSSPVLHVDAGNIADVIAVSKIAVKYRDKFDSDIFIHYNCHRLYGHNEGDEPIFTNPKLYKIIRSSTDLYTELKSQNIKKGLISEAEIEAFESQVRASLTSGLEGIKEGGKKPIEDLVAIDNSLESELQAYPEIETKVSQKIFDEVKEVIGVVPQEVNIHPKVKKIIESRYKALSNSDDYLVDWGCAELMAYGSLLKEGKKVRLSGQDSRRGTFSHRHSIYVDQEHDEKPFNPLDKIKEGAFSVFNSPLSEYGVMGFDYGYSIKTKETLTIWEAQFGDFYNGATIIVDQYITSTRSKWQMDSSLVLYLPHGMEGMGSEHSSARIERFLQLAGRKNLRVFYPTTPGQIFHLIRAQALCEDKIPLIVFTPKSLLRHPGSKASELLKGKLEPVLVRGKGDEKRVIFCSGKISLELEKADPNQSCAIIRLEQLYPFPEKQIKEVVNKFPQAESFVYVQEEAMNQGAYSFVRDYLLEIIDKKDGLQYVGGIRLESTATGFSSVFKYNQARIIKKAIEG